MQPAPSDFLFDASDSMLAGRTLGMSIWAVHNEQQARDRETRQDSTLLALHYPFTICNVPIVLFDSTPEVITSRELDWIVWNIQIRAMRRGGRVVTPRSTASGARDHGAWTPARLGTSDGTATEERRRRWRTGADEDSRGVPAASGGPTDATEAPSTGGRRTSSPQPE